MRIERCVSSTAGSSLTTNQQDALLEKQLEVPYEDGSGHSFGSTFTADREPDKAPEPSRRVHFREPSNLDFDQGACVRQEDIDKTWYNALDCAEFKREAARQARSILSCEEESRHGESWLKHLHYVHQLLCDVKNEDCVETIKVPPKLWDEGCLGLERYVVHSIAHGRRTRHRWLLGQIKRWQQSAGDHSEKVARITRDVSRPSRLISRYLAMVVTDSLD
jgi:hypothetical protein